MRRDLSVVIFEMMMMIGILVMISEAFLFCQCLVWV